MTIRGRRRRGGVAGRSAGPAGLGVVALAVLACAAPAAHASSTQESLFQDDNQLIYSNPPDVARTLDTLAALGVERLRISVFWRGVAPDATSATRPSFRADDPNAYPAANWARYDTVVREAAARRIGVDFDVTSPAPSWALGPTRDRDPDHNWSPSAREYALFLAALGARYNGSFTPASTAPSAPASPPQPTTSSGGMVSGLLPPGGGASSAPAAAVPGDAAATGTGPLPRVSFWSLWNEPNQPGWLLPQWRRDRRAGLVERSPQVYRALMDGGYFGLVISGHAHDTITIGETAPKGSEGRGTAAPLPPVHFMRRLYCLDDRRRFLRGAVAAAEGCPTRNQAASFPRLHPALFAASGFADHPYTLLTAPHIVSLDPDFAALGELGRVTSLLDRAFTIYHRRRAGGMPLYLNEYGYQTNPPDPLGLPQSTQAAYLNEADYIASRNPRVRSLSQFLLRDDKPLAGAAPGTPAYWSTFQSGLELADGSPKPSLAAYRLPIFLAHPIVRVGHSLVVWGQLRLAPRNTRQVAQLQFSPSGSKGWQPLATRATSNPRGFLSMRVGLPGTGLMRLAWTDQAGVTFYSRAAPAFLVRR